MYASGLTGQCRFKLQKVCVLCICLLSIFYKVFWETHCDSVSPRWIRSNRYRSTQMRMLSPSSTLHHSLMLNYRNSQCYCITSKSSRQFCLLISKLFSILLDVVLECNLEDTDHPGPTTMNVQIFSPERKTGEALIFFWRRYPD